MKTLFIKKGMPVATAVLAIVGAFATTSMQSSSSAFELKTGFSLDIVSKECDIAVICSTTPSPMVCRLSYPNGDQAFNRNALGNCTSVLYRPQ